MSCAGEAARRCSDGYRSRPDVGHTADESQNAQVYRDTAREHEHPFGYCVWVRELTKKTGTPLRVRCADNGVNFSFMSPGHPDTKQHRVEQLK